MKKQSGNVLVALILVAAVVVLALWFFMKSGYKLPSQTAQNNAAPAIQNKSGLDSASKQLDGTDLNQMDSGLNQLSSDSASF